MHVHSTWRNYIRYTYLVVIVRNCRMGRVYTPYLFSSEEGGVYDKFRYVLVI